jgi:hypothetical protein
MDEVAQYRKYADGAPSATMTADSYSRLRSKTITNGNGCVMTRR